MNKLLSKLPRDRVKENVFLDSRAYNTITVARVGWKN